MSPRAALEAAVECGGFYYPLFAALYLSIEAARLLKAHNGRRLACVNDFSGGESAQSCHRVLAGGV
jgi:hypothetical protein